MRRSRNRRLPERGKTGGGFIEAPALPPLLENEIQGRGGDFRGLAPKVGRSRIDNPWAVGRKECLILELESFETGIDLRAYAAEQGYQLDRKESWRGSSVMRHPNGDKVIIKRGSDSHYVYFSVRR